MPIRLRVDYRKYTVTSYLKGEITLPVFGRYAREFSKIPMGELPFVHFADATYVTKLAFSPDQMTPHAEQMIARLVDKEDIAAGIILAPNPKVFAFAVRFRDIAADSFPLEVYQDTDRALDRLNILLSLSPSQRSVPNRRIGRDVAALD